MATDEFIQKYINEALECTTTKAWIVDKENIPKIVAAFQKLCPTIKHAVTMDWDDDTLLWLRLVWEPGTLHSTPQPVVPKTVLKAPSATETAQRSKPPDPPRARYGGPRW
jgi:hypothetical protein